MLITNTNSFQNNFATHTGVPEPSSSRVDGHQVTIPPLQQAL